MALLTAGYWPENFWPDSYWFDNYWGNYGIPHPLYLLQDIKDFSGKKDNIEDTIGKDDSIKDHLGKTIG
jgi:hypothetical protein